MLTQFIITAERGIVAAIVVACVVFGLFVAWTFTREK